VVKTVYLADVKNPELTMAHIYKKEGAEDWELAAAMSQILKPWLGKNGYGCGAGMTREANLLSQKVHNALSAGNINEARKSMEELLNNAFSFSPVKTKGQLVLDNLEHVMEVVIASQANFNDYMGMIARTVSYND